MPRTARKHVLIIVQNLPLPTDRRVWLECTALRDAGWEVSAITPMAPGDLPYRELEGVHLYKYPSPNTSVATFSYVKEFAYCWLQTARLAMRIWRKRRFSVIQACNPPDTFWLLALLFRPRGVRFVFDQHDLCPEVYLCRPHNRLLLRATYWLEHMAHRVADRVISTNESYRRVALDRGGVPPDRVTIVRTGPDDERMRRGEPHPELRRGRDHLAVYLGIMGPQDGLDVLIDAIDHFVHALGRNDCTFAVLGSGDSWQDVRRQVQRLGLEDYVYLPGRVRDDVIFPHLSTADVGLCPDPPSLLNDASTMNKTMEYMSFEVPLVAFDLRETRFSAQDAGVYVSSGSPADFAVALADMLDDPVDRKRRGALGRERVENVLAWRHQRDGYVSVYESLN